ncbi:hypothetical protein LTR47_010804 [Exophiala xenobiotica]|nr:hypothetical protein LTR47_010804 [Exophiala xenobiotica]KAK5245732.1 hypothetical protein LTS06_008866 [Exophiala xenobiotica]KAK5277192.1 hypothetical protein LTR40_010692 [Exophiala xenobiotica]KAK5320657.1 hypothetical protein LTR93_006869 [Exophiala xenobiotica]KAK5351886.1 hypothetical protein LTR61_004136 [Exophiala xenobiotica]
MTAAFSFRWGVLLALIMSLLFSLGVALPAPEQWNSEHGSLVPSKTAGSAGASFGAFTGHHSRLDSCLPLLHHCLSTEDRDSCKNRFDNCLDKKNDTVATAVATASTSAPNLESSKFSPSRTVPTPSTTAVASLEDSGVNRTGAESRTTMGQRQPSQSSSPGAGPTGTPGNDQDQSQDGLGQAIAVNACPFDVMSNIVHPPRPGVEGKPEEILSTLAAGATATHPFTHDPDMGISWKIWRTDIENQSPVQFEWAWIPGMQRSWWDLSMIDAGEVDWLETGSAGEEIVGDADGYGEYVGQVGVRHPFADEGLSLVPDVNEGKCVPILCQPGQEFCVHAYNVWNDWSHQKDCPEHANLRLTLCG